jgi:hypothetical protein
MTALHTVREDWLIDFTDRARERFEAIGYPLPYNLRTSIGWTSKGADSNCIAEATHASASSDGHYEIFVSPRTPQGDNVDVAVAAALTHELAHLAAGFEHGHKGPFKRCATALGLVGRMEATLPGTDWFKWAQPILEEMGPMPMGTIDLSKATAGRAPTAKTSLLKTYCPSCGWLARVTFKHIEAHPYLNCPVPDCTGVLIAEIK